MLFLISVHIWCSGGDRRVLTRRARSGDLQLPTKVLVVLGFGGGAGRGFGICGNCVLRGDSTHM